MRRLSALLLTIAMVCTGCTSGSDDPTPSPTKAEATSVTLASLDLDWPRAEGTFDPPKVPAAPSGFDDAQVDRMAKILTKWSRLAAVDEGMWRSDMPLSDVRPVLPDEAAGTLEQQLRGEVSPNLAVANVFGKKVKVIGSPQVTSAWHVSADKDPANETFVRVELQTRTAYEVKLGNGPSRVIGVLRVQGLSAYPDTTDDYGVSGGWQEFGAGDCALALDDALVPDSDTDEAAKDLETFIRVGSGSKLEMPELGVQEQVDAEYLKRCREGQV